VSARWTQGQIDGAADDFARHYGRDTALAGQAAETLRALAGVARAEAIMAGIRRRVDAETCGEVKS
jgi:hypothetical protein